MVRITYFFDDDFAADEQTLLSAARQIFGTGLDEFLLGVAQGFTSLNWLFECAWRAEDIGVIGEAVGNAIERKGIASANRAGVFRELGFGHFRRFMLPALLQALPIDKLPDVLLERLLQADLGL